MWCFKALDLQKKNLNKCVKPVLCRALLTHTVPEFKWSLIGWWHFFSWWENLRHSVIYVHAQPRGQHVIDQQIFTFLCHWQLKLGVIICAFWHSWLLVQESSSEVGGLKSQLVLVDQSKVINLTPTDIFQLPEFSFWRWIIDSLQFCLTFPAIGVWQAGSCCAGEPDLSPASAH